MTTDKPQEQTDEEIHEHILRTLRGIVSLSEVNTSHIAIAMLRFSAEIARLNNVPKELFVQTAQEEYENLKEMAEQPSN